MNRIRVIARLDIKGPNLIKGIQLEGLRVVGIPQDFAKSYYEQGIDELIYMDTVASLYGRNSLHDIIRNTASEIFVPLTVGGGIRSVEDVREILRAGADKVAVNTAAVQRPELITEISKTFGSQCMVLSVEAKKIAENKWEVYTDNGREKTGIDVIDWVKEGTDLGAGELLVTSVDREGTKNGFDCQLIESINNVVSVPVIASGGMGTLDHLKDVVSIGKADAVAIAGVLHYKQFSLSEIRKYAKENGISVRSL
jgi:imidazole glycerol-phosphate synthase subunit HisF